MTGRKIRSVLLLALLLALPGAAQADVAALSYTDPGGQVKVVAPSQQYVNAVGALSLYLTAGLDRKVGYIITNAAGQTVAEGISDLIENGFSPPQTSPLQWWRLGVCQALARK